MLVTGIAISTACIYLLALFRCFRFKRITKVASGLQPEQITFLLPVHNGADALDTFFASWLSFVPSHQKLVIVCNGCADGSLEKAKAKASDYPNVTVINQIQPHKKAAILAGIARVETPYVWMCDVDVCFTGKFTEAVKQLGDATLQLIPLQLIANGGGLLYTIQKAEWSLLQAITHQFKEPALATMANGGGLVVQTQVFQKLKPYADNMHWNSGDDIFLLQAVKKHGGSVLSASGLQVCSTPAPTTWKGFYEQRTRWGSKNASLKDNAMRLGGILFILRWALPVLLLLSGHVYIILGVSLLVPLVEWLLSLGYRQGQTWGAFVFAATVLPFVYIPVLVKSIIKSIVVHRDRKKAQNAV